MEVNWEMGSLHSHSMHEKDCLMEIERIDLNGEPLFLEVIPSEVHYYIFSNFLTATELKNLAQTCKDLNYVVSDDKLWKRTYITKWLKNADESFLAKHYPTSFKWKEMYQLRATVENKYLQELKKQHELSYLNTSDIDDWRTYLKKGKLLAKHETEDTNEFILLSTIQQEQYISAASLIKDKCGHYADLYYYWGRCIKDLSRFKSGKEKFELLLAEEEKYKIAHELAPHDSYILYCWGINLRFQLDCHEDQDAYNIYREASKKYRTALSHGYLEKYVVWGLGSLKLNYGKRHIASGKWEEAGKYLDKAEKKFKHLQTLQGNGDMLTTFANMFNFACIYRCRSMIEQHFRNDQESQRFETLCTDRLKECSSRKEFLEYLTSDLLELWYWKDYQELEWFKGIREKARPKKLNSPW